MAFSKLLKLVGGHVYITSGVIHLRRYFHVQRSFGSHTKHRETATRLQFDGLGAMKNYQNYLKINLNDIFVKKSENYIFQKKFPFLDLK